jgi:hypothetical protein
MKIIQELKAAALPITNEDGGAAERPPSQSSWVTAHAEYSMISNQCVIAQRFREMMAAMVPCHTPNL